MGSAKTGPAKLVAAPLAAGGGDSIFVHDFVIDCHIGVYAEEKGVTQKVRISVDAMLAKGVHASADEMVEVPSYADIIDGVLAIASEGHINLVETFAERIAAHCLADKRIARARVKIEKLDRGPLRGVEIVRERAGG